MSDLSRRQAVKVLAWTVPVIVTLDVTRADAAFRHSAPPTTSPRTETNTPGAYLPAQGVPVPRSVASTGSLPWTDTNERGEMVAGVAAVAAGAVAVVLSYETRNLA